MLQQIKIIAHYVSGRQEVHFVKATKGPRNKALQYKLESLRKFPTVEKVEIINPNKREEL